MGLRSWWHDRQFTRARRYLAAQPDLALAALRQSPELAIAAVNTVMVSQIQALQAAGARPDRKTAPWPILTQLGHGARHALTQTLPKVTPYNLRRFSEYPPARRAINALTNPLVELAWQIRTIPDPDDPKAEATPEEQWQIALARRSITPASAPGTKFVQNGRKKYPFASIGTPRTTLPSATRGAHNISAKNIANVLHA